jgi:hypothetical protein
MARLARLANIALKPLFLKPLVFGHTTIFVFSIYGGLYQTTVETHFPFCLSAFLIMFI